MLSRDPGIDATAYLASLTRLYRSHFGAVALQARFLLAFLNRESKRVCCVKHPYRCATLCPSQQLVLKELRAARHTILIEKRRTAPFRWEKCLESWSLPGGLVRCHCGASRTRIISAGRFVIFRYVNCLAPACCPASREDGRTVHRRLQIPAYIRWKTRPAWLLDQRIRLTDGASARLPTHHQ